MTDSVEARKRKNVFSYDFWSIFHNRFESIFQTDYNRFFNLSRFFVEKKKKKLNNQW